MLFAQAIICVENCDAQNFLGLWESNKSPEEV